MKILLLLLVPAFTFGQTIYKGTIINKTTKDKVPFATVGLSTENTGTNADENGQFKLTSRNGKSGDTIIISCVGYETLKLPISKLSTIVELNEKQIILADVTIASKTKWTYRKLNDQVGCGESSLSSSGFQTQVAKLLTSPSDNAMLTEVKICKRNHLFETHKTIFRLRFYDMDTITKSPSTDLCNEIVEINSSSRDIRVNLEKYKIHIPNRNFFVAVEWLKVPYNENRYKTKVNDKETEHVSYRPFIGINHNAQYKRSYVPGAPSEIWGLTYQNKWFTMLTFENISISATVKY